MRKTLFQPIPWICTLKSSRKGCFNNLMPCDQSAQPPSCWRSHCKWPARPDIVPHRKLKVPGHCRFCVSKGLPDLSHLSSDDRPTSLLDVHTSGFTLDQHCNKKGYSPAQTFPVTNTTYIVIFICLLGQKSVLGHPHKLHVHRPPLKPK